LKWDRSTWSGSALVELSERRVLMGWMGPRHRKMQEAKGGRGILPFSIFKFD